MTKKNKVTLSGRPAEHGSEKLGAPAPVDPATGMHKDYWILSQEERSKGFIRPVRLKYRHVGRAVCGKQDCKGVRLGGPRRVCTMQPRHEGKHWHTFVQLCQPDAAEVERAQLMDGCGTVTSMALAIAETYARDPKFYGATFCVGCRDHFPVGEHGQFVWDGSKEMVGT